MNKETALNAIKLARALRRDVVIPCEIAIRHKAHSLAIPVRDFVNLTQALDLLASLLEEAINEGESNGQDHE
jgi:hypothetical protein